MAKHSTPRRRSGKHWVGTLLTAGAVVACMWLLLRFLPVGTIPTGGDEPSDSAVSSTEPAASSVPEPEPEPVVETLRFSATGDDLIHSPIYKQAARRAANGQQYDFDYCYAQVAPFYAQQDINWINQETLCSDELEPSSYPCFSTPGDCARALYRAGIRVFSLSNNHSYDKGAAGIDASREHWAAMPDDVVSMGFYNLETYDDYVYQTVNGITFGYLSYTEHTNGLPTPSSATYGVVYLSDLDIIEQQIAAMRPNCDVLVVSCHWGVEGSHDVEDSQRQMAQWLADHDVDLIIGTHPHVTQTAEWLTGAEGHTSFVAYSLGNFLNAQSSPDNMIGAVLDITFQKTTQSDGSSAVEMQDPKLHCVISQYEDGWKNIREYPYSAYTDELGAAHGNFTLTREYIESVLYGSIDEQFVTLD